MKKKNVWLIVAIVCLVLGIASACGMVFCKSKTEGIEDLNVSTGVKNRSLAYDPATERLYIGTHESLLVAFQGEEEIWRAQAGGSFSELVLDADNDRLYASNEDNHVYVYQASDGTLVQDINVQRKAVGLDANKDGSKIAVITQTGSNKSNLLIYSAEGEELFNDKYTYYLKGVKYCSDGETLLLANKRGEVLHITEDGEKLGSYSTNYDVEQMIRNGDVYWVVNKGDYYFELTEDLQCLRSGKADNSIDARISSIGVDAENEYVLIGTKEGWMFVIDGNEKQIATIDLSVQLTDFQAVGDSIYITGSDDFVKVVHVDNLAMQDFFQNMVTALRIAMIVFLVLCVIGLIQWQPSTRAATAKLLKSMWRHKIAYIMLLPTFILIFFFNYRGIFVALTRAFTDWSRTKNTVAKMDFVGLDNFKAMFTEGYFFVGMKNLVILMVTGILKTISVPLLAAWMVNALTGDKRKYIHRFLFVLPIVVPGAIGSMIWQRIYDPNNGLINNLLASMNLESLQHVWLGDARTAIWAVVFMGFPFVGAMAFLVYYGGLINIDSGIIESARIDGASRAQIFWKVQLPMIRPQISLMITLCIIGTMQDFNGIYILTGGGPGVSTYVPALELYYNAAQFGRYGYASALGVVLLIFTLTVTMISNRLTREKE